MTAPTLQGSGFQFEDFGDSALGAMRLEGFRDEGFEFVSGGIFRV